MSETEYKLLMPQAIWETFDPNAPLETEEEPAPDGKVFVYTALDAPDGKVRVQLEAKLAEESGRAPTVLIIQEYHRSPDPFLVDAI